MQQTGYDRQKEFKKAKRRDLKGRSNPGRSWRSKQMVSRIYNNVSTLRRDPCNTRTSRTRWVAVGIESGFYSLIRLNKHGDKRVTTTPLPCSDHSRICAQPCIFYQPFLYGRIDTFFKTLPYLHPLPILIACHSYIDLNLSQISQYSPLSD